jgi:hypothetical protein
MTGIQEVEKYLNDFMFSSDIDCEGAYHDIMDLHDDPAVIEYLMTQFSESTDTDIKREVISLLIDFQAPSTVSFFGELLLTEDWKLSLDALVAIGNDNALEELKYLNYTISPADREWVREAIEQINEKSYWDRTPHR